MKKHIHIIATLLSLLFYNCGEENKANLIPNGNLFIAPTSEQSVLEDNSNGIKTTIAYSDVADNDIQVNFTVESTDANRYEVSPSSGIAIIKKGEVSTDIIITPIDNIAVDGDINITISLNTNNSKPIGLEGNGKISTTKLITLKDNDCPIIFKDMAGSYTGEHIIPLTPDPTKTWLCCGGNQPAKITVNYDENNQTISLQGFGFGFVEGPWWNEKADVIFPVVVDVDPNTGEFQFDRVKHFHNQWGTEYYVEGYGKYLSCSNQLELNYRLYYKWNGVFYHVWDKLERFIETLTKQ